MSLWIRIQEIARGARGLIKMVGNQTILSPPSAEELAAMGKADSGASAGRATEKKPQTFTFDKSYWSAGPRDDPGYCSQQTLYDDLGRELLDHAFSGFNACIMACESYFVFYTLFNSSIFVDIPDADAFCRRANRLREIV